MELSAAIRLLAGIAEQNGGMVPDYIIRLDEPPPTETKPVEKKKAKKTLSREDEEMMLHIKQIVQRVKFHS